MCSIIGYLGDDDAAPILVKGLKRMEYRGYDSVGIATESDNKIEVKKGIGKVAEVNQTHQLDSLNGKIGIGHTRWATHGNVTEKNAHPHSSNSGKIALVHNGIIENYQEIKEMLLKNGFDFNSETDSEVITNLIQFYFEKTKDIKQTLLKTSSLLKGHYAFVIMFEDGTLAAVRYHEPLIIGIINDGYFLSSDVLGFIEKTDDVIYPNNGNLIIINGTKMNIFDFNGDEVKYQITKVSKEFADAYKGDYAHFTLKEISEQPYTIVKAGEKTEDKIIQTAKIIKSCKTVYITGSGTSYNAALIAKYLFAKYAKIKTDVIISSEITFAPETLDSDSAMIAISQSGESADVLEAVNVAKKENVKVISIVNHTTSTLAQESQIVLGMNCGPEIGVAATKSFTSQLAIIYKIISEMTNKEVRLDFDFISKSILEILGDHSEIQKISSKLRDISDIYVLGRGIHFPIALESALKLKELTYIHAEGIPGGELKHGPLALMDESVFVVIINPSDSTFTETLTSAREIKARGAKIIGISDKNSDAYDYWIKIPSVEEIEFPIIEMIPIQLLAYYSAVEKETDPDYPRNLAKSVTVK